MYYVFKRTDGYVGAINVGTPINYWGKEWNSRSVAEYRLRPGTVEGTPVTYEILLESDDWIECEDLLRSERAKG